MSIDLAVTLHNSQHRLPRKGAFWKLGLGQAPRSGLQKAPFLGNLLMSVHKREGLHLAIRQQQVLYDKKWKKFLGRARFFRHIPFVEFAVAAGSMAIGNVSPTSDFDVIVSVRRGRIFSARFFAIVFFSFFGWRRKRLSHNELASDKICLNHFITSDSMVLEGPYSDSWRNLYRNLVPLWGDKDKINAFLAANRVWAGDILQFADDLRFSRLPPSIFKNFSELVLDGYFGDILERIVKYFQVKKIERSLRRDVSGYMPRINYTDFELELQPDRRKFEKMIGE